MSGVMELLDSPIATLQCMVPGAANRPTVEPLAWRGFSKVDERRYLDSLRREDRPLLPAVDLILAQTQESGSLALSRTMGVPDEAWYESSFYRDYVAQTGLDGFGIAFREAPQLRAFVTLGGAREAGAPPIEPERLKLLGILTEVIAPALHTTLALRGQVSMAGLTRRQRQTLALLLDGLSEKEVAARLHLSSGTVHDYIVQLYRHFAVSSRAELLSYFIQRRPKERNDNCSGQS